MADFTTDLLKNLSIITEEVAEKAKSLVSQKARFKDVVFTVVEEETYTYSNDVTDKPLEDGSVITDHFQNKPITIHLSGIITGQGNYPQQQLDLLRRYCIQGVVDQYYGIQTLWNFIITNFENKHTADVADGCAFEMDLQQVLTAKREVVNILTSDISIPDIAAIKDQLSKNDTSSAEVMRTRVIAPTRTNKQAKEVLDASNQAISSQIKAIY